MTILNNIYRCKLCKIHLIAEESPFHICRSLKDSRVDDEGIKHVFDGEKWYPLNINRKFTDKKTTVDYTDTSIIHWIIRG